MVHTEKTCLPTFLHFDLKEMELTWEEAQQLSVNKEWGQSVQQCVIDTHELRSRREKDPRSIPCSENTVFRKNCIFRF